MESLAFDRIVRPTKSKWAIASIPAFIILFLLGLIASAVFGGMLATLGWLAK